MIAHTFIFLLLLLAAFTILVIPIGMFYFLRHMHRRWNISIKTWGLIGMAFALSGFCYYRYGTAAGILARYNVHFNPDAVHYASPNLNTIRFWYDGPKGKLEGPEIFGDNLFVDRVYRTRDEKIEIVIRSPGREAITQIQLVLPPENGIAFKMMPGYDRYGCTYRPQGIIGGP